MKVAIVLYHEVHELAVVGPYSVFIMAKQLLENPEDLEVFTVAKSRNSVQTDGGLTITPLYAFASVPQADVLIVPGGSGVDKAVKDKALTNYLLETQPRLKMLVSISSGALLLGPLGFLRNQVVTSHPDDAEALEAFEVLQVSSERIVKNPSGLWACSGVMAGIELSLALLEQLYSAELSRKVTRYLGIAVSQPGLF